ncbi:MAG: hypothetical protein RQ750_10655 [Roseovarius sp.]|nr:hypothetical protein [Roseovarius sp.]
MAQPADFEYFYQEEAQSLGGMRLCAAKSLELMEKLFFVAGEAGIKRKK